MKPWEKYQPGPWEQFAQPEIEQAPIPALQQGVWEGPDLVPRGPAAGIMKGMIEMPAGLLQTGLRGTQALGLTSPETSQKFTEKVSRSLEGAKQFEDMPGFTTASMLTESAPYLAINPIKAGQTLLTKMGLSGLLGGAFGGTQFRPEETQKERDVSRAKVTAGSAALTSAIPGLTPLARRARHPIAALTKKAIDSKVFKESTKLLKSIGVRGNIGDKSGNLAIAELETSLKRGASDKIKKNINLINRSIINSFNDVKKRFTKRGVSREQVGTRIFHSARNRIEDLVKTRQIQANHEFGLVDSVAKNEKIIPIKNFSNFLANRGEAVTPGSGAFLKQTRTALKELERQAVDGKISAKQAAQFLSDYSQATVGKGKVWSDLERSARKELARSSIMAIEKDLDDAVAAMGKGSKAATLLREARNNYRINSQPINEIEESYLGALINKDSAKLEDIAENINKMKPSQIKQTVRLLKEWDKGAVDKIKAFRLDNALEKASRKAPNEPIDVTRFDPDVMLKELGEADTLKALYNADELTRLKKSIDAVHIIGTKSTSSGGGRTIMTTAEQAAAVGPKMDPTFISLNIARFFNPIGLRKIFLTQRGQNKLIKLANSLDKPFKNQAQISQITSSLVDELEED